MIIKIKRQLSCLRCGYCWNPRKEDVRICPKCKSAYWDKKKTIRYFSEETKRKLRESKIGKKNPFYGKRHSKEANIKNSEAHKGEKNYFWKGGIKKEHGRIYILKPLHPYADKNGYVSRSRLIMEEILGRYLLPEEIVHHKNKITDDDRPENLELFENKAKHTTFHNHSKETS